MEKQYRGIHDNQTKNVRTLKGEIPMGTYIFTDVGLVNAKDAHAITNAMHKLKDQFQQEYREFSALEIEEDNFFTEHYHESLLRIQAQVLQLSQAILLSDTHCVAH